jgi:hypothetical protein
MLALVGPLVAFSTAAQQQAVVIQSGLQAAIGQAKACEQQVDNRPEYAALRPHLHGGNPTAAELADTSLPTAAEAELLKHYTVDHAACESAFSTQIAVTEPAVAHAVNQYVFDFNSVYADLIMRKITWAEAARREQEVDTRDGRAVSGAHGAVMGTLAAQHRQEVAERRESWQRVAIGLMAVSAALKASEPVYASPARAPDPSPPLVSGPLHCRPNGNVEFVCQ